MTITTQSLVAIVVELLSTPTTADIAQPYPTAAGSRVYAPRDWPTWDLQYPALFVSAPREHKESQGRSQPQYTVNSTIRLAARVSAPGDANDMNAGVVQDALWTIQRQIEIALINATVLRTQIQKIASIDATLTFDSKGEKHLGELLIDMDMEFFQGPWDFTPIVGTDVTLVNVTTPLPVRDPTTAQPSVGAAITLPSAS